MLCDWMACVVCAVVMSSCVTVVVMVGDGGSGILVGGFQPVWMARPSQ